MAKRHVDIVVLSDVHLGTYGCHAREVLQYLQSIDPDVVVLNGDIIDMWQFRKRYWPATHMMVVRHIIGLIAAGKPVYYIPGNHDEMLRRFKGFSLGSLKIDNKLSLTIGNDRVWIFHGDVFDVAMKHSRWIARLGAVGYDMLILINRFVNFVLARIGKGKISFSKKVKNSVKSAVKFISNFEDTVCTIAADNNYQFVICGHIHHPEIRTVLAAHGQVIYMNSGDWVENLTSLEFADSKWRIYYYQEDAVAQSIDVDRKEETSASQQALLDNLTERLQDVSGMAAWPEFA